MKSTKFPIYMLDTVAGDIFGLMVQSSGQIIKKGLKDKALRFDIKHHLKRLGVKITDELNSYKESVEELKKEYNIGPDQTDENLESFQKKIVELNKTMISIEHYEFKVEDFSTLGPIEEDYTILDILLHPDEELK